MLARLAIRFLTSLVGIAVGLLLCTAVLSGFSIDVSALALATLLFWAIHIAVQFMALRVLVRQPSVVLAGLLALASTIVALVIVNVAVSGLTIKGASTYVGATLIIWVATATSDTIGSRMIRDRRSQRRSGSEDR